MLNTIKYKILDNPNFYNFSQRIISRYGGTTKYFIKKCVLPLSPKSILEIGCGTGNLLYDLPGNIEYTGIDISSDYVKSAKKKFRSRGRFLLGSVLDYDFSKLGKFDLVLAHGFFHHVNNATIMAYLDHIEPSLTDDSNLLSIDPCFVAKQNIISHFIVSNDRGKYVRSEKEYTKLLKKFYFEIKSVIRDDLLVFPYHTCILFCQGRNFSTHIS